MKLFVGLCACMCIAVGLKNMTANLRKLIQEIHN